jgi:t-SNARE complex subunit (syntaxin)
MIQELNFSNIKSKEYNSEEADAILEKQYDELILELNEIKELSEIINSYVINQGEHINITETNIESVVDKIENGTTQIKQALSYKKMAIVNKTILVGTCATVVTLPLSFLIGIKLSLVTGACIIGSFAFNSIFN